MGGGTTLVEALALGRNSIGSDLNELALFIAHVKTRIYTEQDLACITAWLQRLPTKLTIAKKISSSKSTNTNYTKHLNSKSRWRIRKAIQLAIDSVSFLPSEKLQGFAKCVILCTSQWALDGKKSVPTLNNFRKRVVSTGYEMIEGARSLRISAKENKKNNQRNRKTVSHCLNRSIIGLEQVSLIKKLPAPRLVVTSPPYPGTHILYHRWQVDGGKETAAPYWISGKRDGAGSSYYTMGDRHQENLWMYFENLRKALKSLTAVCNMKTTIVQVVAFSDPSWQLPKYLKVAESVGLKEIKLPKLRGRGDGRLWRAVPSRRWYTERLKGISTNREVIFFHRLAKEK